jgi:hypothetical protein
LNQVELEAIKPQIETIGELAKFASHYPYYKYNFRWTKNIQTVLTTLLLTAWLGGLGSETRPGELGRLLTIEECGQILQGTGFTIMTPSICEPY